jgi:HSP20 family protein
MAQKAKAARSRAVTPWEPLFMDPKRWEREIDRVAEELFGPKMRPWWPSIWSWGVNPEPIMPAVDVYEEKDDIVVKAELPGVQKDNIEVRISDSELTLKGEKHKEEKVEEAAYYQCELYYGAFIRTLQLPAEVEADKITASFKGGVLEIRLPRSPEAKSKEVKIKID